MNFCVFFQLNTNKLNSLTIVCQLIYGGPNEGRRLSSQFVIFRILQCTGSVCRVYVPTKVDRVWQHSALILFFLFNNPS